MKFDCWIMLGWSGWVDFGLGQVRLILDWVRLGVSFVRLDHHEILCPPIDEIYYTGGILCQGRFGWGELG